MKNLILLFVLSMCSIEYCRSQIEIPVNISYAAKKTSGNTATIFIKATIDNDWHIYSSLQNNGGPLRTSLNFAKSENYKLVGQVAEPIPIRKYEKTFGIEVFYFEKEVIFKQKIILKSKRAIVKGKIEFMACDDHQCMPPREVNFIIPIN
ncbi:sugar transporter [Pedobacter sp. LMG 31464]|uniref:Sugar transporter n=1 Tax=Pedobacter planticolens TaxID=2679964 RepID=A0A923IV92_9SPHI|nr:protein-disulfide reductase DsbD domain-containing protein [Pedobacter planticolens]MBB2146805.1 sugar transporter [Pedobacter planticolens]